MTEITGKARNGRLAALAAVLAIVLGMLANSAWADQQRVPVTPANTEQKAKFVGNLVSHSAASRIIEASDDEAAKAALQQARGLVEEAGAAIADGRFETAEGSINRALSLVMEHSRRLSESNVKADWAQKTYEARLTSLKALLDAYGRVAEEKNQGGAASERRAAVLRGLAEAEASAGSGNYQNALAMTEILYQGVAAAVAELRDGDKLVKTLRFDSPHDEYIYEVDRNDSHFYLLKLTLSEKTPHPSFVPRIDGLRAEAEQFRGDAEVMAGQDRHPEAIEALGASTERLIKALRMAGAYIPG